MENDVEKDLKIALDIINCRYIPLHYHFDTTSSIFRATNEQLSKYEHFFIKKTKMLSVIASGEQIFNAILEGVDKIEAFDISTFPKYFLFLKKAGIQALTRDKYIDFFYKSIIEHYKSKRIYDKYSELYFNKIRKYLTGDYLFFWDSLFKKFTWEKIYFSNLFVEKIDEKENIIKNKYLKPTNFEELKRKISNVKIEVYTGNVFDLISKFRQENDLIYLSNIYTCRGLYTYLAMHSRLKLSRGGISLSYNFGVMTEANVEACKELGFQYNRFSSDEGILIYRKK